jgi:NAD(P)-dependent dehydrogenase (short-subunit alcohol dehydrogenase family)
MGELYKGLFPPTPTFTDQDLPSLESRIFVVTGGNSGIGLEIVKMLYAKSGTVYIAGRSPTKISTAIDEIKSLHPNSKGQLKTLQLNLGDLRTVKPCAEAFLSQESRLDVLFNNAGIGVGAHKGKGTHLHDIMCY